MKTEANRGKVLDSGDSTKYGSFAKETKPKQASPANSILRDMYLHGSIITNIGLLCKKDLA